MTKRRAKGEGSVVHRADGTWQFSIDLGKDAAGKRQRRYIYAKSRAELQRKVTDERARSGGSIQPRAPGTVGEWMSAWLSEIKGALNPNAFVGYNGAWRLHAAPLVASRSMEKFDVEDVQALYRRLEAAGVSASVVNRVATVMHRAFQVAIRRRAYQKLNPFGLVDRPRVARPKTRVLEPAEVRAFLEAALGDRYEALWTLLVTAGLRLGEALALEWGDVDLKKRTLNVRRSFLEVSGRVELGETKNKTSRRLVTLGKSAVDALGVRQKLAQAEQHGSALIFPTTKGTPLRRSNLRRSHFEPICERALLGHLRIHDLRHTMTSLALVQGVPAKVLAERLGHSTTRLTLDRYSHLIGDIQTVAADAIEEAIGHGKRAPSRTKKRK